MHTYTEIIPWQKDGASSLKNTNFTMENKQQQNNNTVLSHNFSLFPVVRFIQAAPPKVKKNN